MHKSVCTLYRIQIVAHSGLQVLDNSGSDLGTSPSCCSHEIQRCDSTAFREFRNQVIAGILFIPRTTDVYAALTYPDLQRGCSRER